VHNKGLRLKNGRKSKNANQEIGVPRSVRGITQGTAYIGFNFCQGKTGGMGVLIWDGCSQVGH
ncbi:MAG: hypothetical protein WAN25_08830, partial [Candidatus Acidiferrum sp.]